MEFGPAQKPSDLVYQLYASPDGVTWTRQATYDPHPTPQPIPPHSPSRPGLVRSASSVGIGSPGDDSSAIFNPFRNVTILSSKATDSTLGRHRKYAESNVFSEAAFGAAPLVPWVAADVLDPPWMGSAQSGHVNHTSAAVPELYALDGVAYESVMLGSFRIFRCKEHYAGCDAMYMLLAPREISLRPTLPPFRSNASLWKQVLQEWHL